MSDYPVKVSYPQDEEQNKAWGILWFGMIVRAILVIPQIIVLAVLGFVAFFVMLVNWIPVLLNGRQATWAYTLIGGMIRLSTRVSMYVALLTGTYPPFGPGGEHTVNVTYDESETQNRLWGIPLFGVWVRWIILIPHFIVLWLLGIVSAILTFFAWIPILINGRQSELVLRWVGGTYRWGVRVYAYATLLTGTYPPFRLED